MSGGNGGFLSCGRRCVIRISIYGEQCKGGAIALDFYVLNVYVSTYFWIFSHVDQRQIRIYY